MAFVAISLQGNALRELIVFTYGNCAENLAMELVIYTARMQLFHILSVHY